MNRGNGSWSRALCHDKRAEDDRGHVDKTGNGRECIGVDAIWRVQKLYNDFVVQLGCDGGRVLHSWDQVWKWTVLNWQKWNSNFWFSAKLAYCRYEAWVK